MSSGLCPTHVFRNACRSLSDDIPLVVFSRFSVRRKARASKSTSAPNPAGYHVVMLELQMIEDIINSGWIAAMSRLFHVLDKNAPLIVISSKDHARKAPNTNPSMLACGR